MTLSRFEIDFQGGQMRVRAKSTLKGSLTYVTARRAGQTAMVSLVLESKSRQDYGHDVHELGHSVQT